PSRLPARPGPVSGRRRASGRCRAATRGRRQRARPRRSTGDALAGGDLLGEDLLDGRAFPVPRDLTLGCVPIREREPRRRAELVRDRPHPLEQLLEPRTRRNGLAPLEVDEITRHPPPQRTPEVFLEQPVRMRWQGLLLVEGARDASCERIAERCERARLSDL